MPGPLGSCSSTRAFSCAKGFPSRSKLPDSSSLQGCRVRSRSSLVSSGLKASKRPDRCPAGMDWMDSPRQVGGRWEGTWEVSYHPPVQTVLLDRTSGGIQGPQVGMVREMWCTHPKGWGS